MTATDRFLERIAAALDKLVEIQLSHQKPLIDRPCQVEGHDGKICGRKVVARGMCSGHYQRVMLKGQKYEEIPIQDRSTRKHLK